MAITSRISGHLAAALNEPPSDDDEQPPDWVPKRHRARQTSQLLLIGAVLAIVGLVLSLTMLLFNKDCNPRYYLGSAVNRTGEFEMCYENHHESEVAPGNVDIADNLVVAVPYRKCSTDDDCGDFRHGFCAGGPTDLRVAGYCQDNPCTCKRVLPDCGLHTYFAWTYTASDYIPSCAGAACNKSHTIQVPYWMYDESFGGCTFRRKTRPEDALLWIQHTLDDVGVVTPLLSMNSRDDEGVWKELKGHLSRTPEVQFYGFWPSTISESVSDGFSPSGRIFLGFMLCSSLCLLASNYPTEVLTVDLPSKKIPILGIQWNTLRTWMPPIGLILLSTVQMVPTSKIVNMPTALMTVVHLLGAQFCFLVYLICEAAALLDRKNRSEMEHIEWHIRTVIIVIGSVAMGTFAFMYALLFLISGTEFTPYLRFSSESAHTDLYKHSYSFSAPSVHILRAGDGWWVGLKVVSYIAEYMVALAILVSLLVIWLFFERSRRRIKGGLLTRNEP